VLVRLACACAQAISGAPLLVSALWLGLHPGDHAHSFALLADAGHVDLVLSHAGSEAHDHRGALHVEDPSGSFAQGDHVFHIAGGDGASTTARRDGLAAMPALASAIARPFAPASQGALRTSLERRARSPGHPGAAVLRC
jgi:hypothetical protein